VNLATVDQEQVQEAPSHAQKLPVYVQLSGVAQVDPALGLLAGQVLGLHCHDAPVQVQILSAYPQSPAPNTHDPPSAGAAAGQVHGKVMPSGPQMQF
jgi:hypothetical protein